MTPTAYILAGGQGTRLHPVIHDRPKVLAPVRGRPFLAYLLDQLGEAGVQRVILGTGYMAVSVHATFGDSYQGLPLAYCEEKSPLGTGGALRLALPLFPAEPILVMNGDSYFPADLAAFHTSFQERSARAAMLLAEVPDVRRFGQVRCAPDQRLTAFEEKGTATGSGWINAGVYLVKREVIEGIIPERPVSLEREVFPALIGEGFYGFPGDAPFLDIGTPESYRAAEEFFALTRPSSVPPPPPARAAGRGWHNRSTSARGRS